MKVYTDMGKGTKFRRRNTHTAVRAGGFSLVELLVVVAIIAILAAISVPLYLNQKKKAGDATIRSDVHNVAVHLATTYTSPVTAVAGSDGATTPDLTVTTADGTVDVIPKMGTSVYANTTAWCISDIATSGKIFAATSTNRATYEATTICTTPTTQPTPGSGGGGTVVSAVGNLTTAAQATPSGGYNGSSTTTTYSGGIATTTSTRATIGSVSSYLSPAVAVTENTTYTTTVTVTNTVGADWFIFVRFYNSSGSSILQSPSSDTITAGGTGTLTLTATAPVGAVSARTFVSSNAAITGNSASFNQVGFWEGTGGQRAPPGQPIYQ